MVPRRGSDRVSRVIGVNGVHRQNPRGFYPFELVSMLRECVHENCGPPRQLVQGGRKQEELLGVQVMERGGAAAFRFNIYEICINMPGGFKTVSFRSGRPGSASKRDSKSIKSLEILKPLSQCQTTELLSRPVGP